MILPAVVAALQQPRLLEKALGLSNTASSLPLMRPIPTCLQSCARACLQKPCDYVQRTLQPAHQPYTIQSRRSIACVRTIFLSYCTPWLQEHKNPFQIVSLPEAYPTRKIPIHFESPLDHVYDVQIPNMFEIKSSEAVIVPKLCLCLSLLLLSLIFATFQAIWKLFSATWGGGRSGAMFENIETMSGHVRTTVTACLCSY